MSVPLSTNCVRHENGDLDITAVPAGTTGCDDLRRESFEVGLRGVQVRLASLADIVRSKEAAGREKDRRALPVLRELVARQLRERNSPMRREAAMGAVHLHRVYDGDPPGDAPAFLVERLWPRGVRRDQLRLAGWCKDAAPSTELRRWFGHDPAKWAEFRRRYVAELEARPEAVEPLLAAARTGEVTLLYSSRDREHNNVVVLRDYLQRGSPGSGHRSRGADPGSTSWG